jgi:glycosyltransferase involved in cell wall biosynthesis
MIKVLLINQEKIPHYRIAAFNYLAEYLGNKGFELTIVSEGVQEGNTHKVGFKHNEISLTFANIAKVILEQDPEVIIYWVRLRHLYLFPMILFIKLLGKKAIYWGHGIDLYSNEAIWLKKFANNIEYRISDALILYGGHLKKYVNSRHHYKTFIANNTLYFNEYQPELHDKERCLKKFGIKTSKNIIYMGRMQRRKKLEDLFEAFKLIDRKDIGLILVGPDKDGILDEIQGDNVYKLGSIYGDDRLDLLASSDVFCMPGPVGLSIVDSFYCSLPIVTEAGDESPESMYLKNGINGFIVPKGDVKQLAARLRLLLEDDKLRGCFARAAKTEISTNGHIDRMCEGFSNSLRYVCDPKS